MRRYSAAILAITLSLLGACNRQDSGAVGTNDSDGETAGMPAAGEATIAMPPNAAGAMPSQSSPGQTPPSGQPGGAPSMETSQPDQSGSSVGDSGTVPK